MFSQVRDNFFPGDALAELTVRSQGLDDKDLISLAGQMGDHVESMQGNLSQIAGIVPAITKSRAALQEVLAKHLNVRQYTELLPG